MNAIVLNMIHFFPALFLLFLFSNYTPHYFSPLLSKQVISNWICFYYKKTYGASALCETE